MAEQQTPLEVMFSVFKSSYRLSHRSLAELILSDRPLSNGQTPAQMARDTSWLSRAVVHSRPGTLQDRYFSDPCIAAKRVLRTLHKKGFASKDFCTVATAMSADMADALVARGCDGNLFQNAVERLGRHRSNEDDGALLLITLVVYTAYWCNPSAAISYVLDRFDCIKTLESFTPPSLSKANYSNSGEANGAVSKLGLIRMEEDYVIGGPYAVSSLPQGSVVGALALEDGAITNVGLDVSARHLHIYKQNDAWYARDLGSANGTHLTRSSDGTYLDISAGMPIELHPGDCVQLGSSTNFAVVAMSSEFVAYES